MKTPGCANNPDTTRFCHPILLIPPLSWFLSFYPFPCFPPISLSLSHVCICVSLFLSGCTHQHKQSQRNSELFHWVDDWIITERVPWSLLCLGIHITFLLPTDSLSHTVWPTVCWRRLKLHLDVSTPSYVTINENFKKCPVRSNSKVDCCTNRTRWYQVQWDVRWNQSFEICSALLA